MLLVDALLSTPTIRSVPSDGPPIQPTALPPEQPLQEMTLAPLERALVEDSASGLVSVGPGVHVPCKGRIQFTWLCCGRVSGGCENKAEVKKRGEERGEGGGEVLVWRSFRLWLMVARCTSRP